MRCCERRDRAQQALLSIARFLFQALYSWSEHWKKSMFPKLNSSYLQIVAKHSDQPRNQPDRNPTIGHFKLSARTYLKVSPFLRSSQVHYMNTIARVVTLSLKRDHITPTLERLYWLPVSQRVTYKIATLGYKIRSSREPDYLYSFLVDYTPTRHLRSTNTQRLCVEN